MGESWWHTPEAVTGLVLLLQAVLAAWAGLLCWYWRRVVQTLDRHGERQDEMGERLARIEGQLENYKEKS